jgi:predicted nuclease of predicted toxin-antitoxin system
MDFKIDENLPVELAVMLTQAGHDVLTVRDQHLHGRPDGEVVQVCQQEHRALVTCDRDFANTCAYPPEQYAGLLVLRLTRQDKPHVMRVFEGVTPLLRQRPVHGHLWIVEETRIRIRPGPDDAL